MRALALVGLTALAACKPPPTDAAMARAANLPAPEGPSAPLDSPETEGAGWVRSPPGSDRLIYGIPGEVALVALECLKEGGSLPALQVTRMASADEDASALLALVGNGHIGRLPVEAREVNGRRVWQGEALATDVLWEPLVGPRALGLTVPGAGRVEINAGNLPRELIEQCRTEGGGD
jgi:hypothetical protein